MVVSINIIQPLQRKMLAPASVPFNPVFFSLYILLNNLHLHWRKNLKKLPNINKWQGITPMLLFLLNLSLNKFSSGKTKSVPHSPGLPYPHWDCKWFSFVYINHHWSHCSIICLFIFDTNGPPPQTRAIVNTWFF